MLAPAPRPTGEMLPWPWVWTQVGSGVGLKFHGPRSPLEQLSQETQTPGCWLAVQALPPLGITNLICSLW